MAIDNMARSLRPRTTSTEMLAVESQPVHSRPMRINPPVATDVVGNPAVVGDKSTKQQYPCIEITPRSVWIGSRRTSIRLEPEFWTALGEISREQRSTISGVLLDIERIHGRSRFASKVRVAILAYYRR